MIYVANSPLHYVGVFTQHMLNHYAVAAEFYGELVPLNDCLERRCLQVTAQTGLLGTGPLEQINHSCDPNCYVRVDLGGVLLVARRHIQPNEELTIDYDASSYDDELGFECGCRSKDCRGIVKGFQHLDAVQRERLRDQLLPYLLLALNNQPQPYGQVF